MLLPYLFKHGIAVRQVHISWLVLRVSINFAFMNFGSSGRWSDNSEARNIYAKILRQCEVKIFRTAWHSDLLSSQQENLGSIRDVGKLL